MATLTDFSLPVYRSFFQEDLILGVKKGIFCILFLVFVIISYLFTIWLGLAITAVLYIPCAILTKIDPNMLSIALASLLEPDRLEG